MLVLVVVQPIQSDPLLWYFCLFMYFVHSLKQQFWKINIFCAHNHIFPVVLIISENEENPRRLSANDFNPAYPEVYLIMAKWFMNIDEMAQLLIDQ